MSIVKNILIHAMRQEENLFLLTCEIQRIIGLKRPVLCDINYRYGHWALWHGKYCSIVIKLANCFDAHWAINLHLNANKNHILRIVIHNQLRQSSVWPSYIASADRLRSSYQHIWLTGHDDSRHVASWIMTFAVCVPNRVYFLCLKCT